MRFDVPVSPSWTVVVRNGVFYTDLLGEQYRLFLHASDNLDGEPLAYAEALLPDHSDDAMRRVAETFYAELGWKAAVEAVSV